MFPHRNIRKYTWACPGGKTQNRIIHILKDTRWHFIILYVWCFRGVNWDSDRCPVVVKVSERLAVSQQAAQKFNVERFNLRKLNDLDIRKEYQSEITSSLAALKSLSDSEEINRAWENINENNKISVKDSPRLYELKQHNSWFDKECLRF